VRTILGLLKCPFQRLDFKWISNLVQAVNLLFSMGSGGFSTGG
jgi:hypothetical protein